MTITAHEVVGDHSILRASLCHYSAVGKAKEAFGKEAVDHNRLACWSTCGKLVLGLCATRWTIGVPGCEKVGTAELASRAILQRLTMRCSNVLHASGLIFYGDGTTERERRSDAMSVSLASQYVGALAEAYGLAGAIGKLRALKIFQSLEVPPDKDPKTRLQEHLQRLRMSLPSYLVDAPTGPAHDQTFSCVVKMRDGRAATGEGRSKKEAEQSAAAALIERLHLTTEDRSLAVAESPLSARALALGIPCLPNESFARQIAQQFNLDDWATKLMSLAFVHPSYGFPSKAGPLGKDNRVLALLGSAVASWAIADIIVRDFRDKTVLSAGNLATLLRLVLNDRSSMDPFAVLALDEKSLLRGAGEAVIAASLKAEAYQALMGALYLAREDSCGNGAQFLRSESISLGRAIASIVTNALAANREELDPAKTRLQERCQAIGVRVVYLSEAQVLYEKTTLTPRLRLVGYGTTPPLLISFPPQSGESHASPRLAAVEEKLAGKVLQAYMAAAGRPGEAPVIEIGDTQKIQRWFLGHMLAYAGRIGESRSEGPFRMGYAMEILGIAYLKSADASGFLRWTSDATRLFGEGFARQLDACQEFYAECGRILAPNELQRQMLAHLDRLSLRLSNADPLTQQAEVRTETDFKELVQCAKAFRLRSRRIGATNAADVLEQARLLLARRSTQVYSTLPKSRSIPAVDGILIELIDTLASHWESRRKDGGATILLREHAGRVCISIRADSLDVDEFQRSLGQDAVWHSLKIASPFADTVTTQATLEIHLAGTNGEATEDAAVRGWWAFHVQHRLSATTDEAISSALHDLKNQLLAFDASWKGAQTAKSKTDKYRLAAEASHHLEEATAQIASVRAICHAGLRVTHSEMHVAPWWRGITQEILTWLPTGVAFTFPTNVEDASIWTNSDSLKAIIVNLVRNSIQAVDINGSIKLGCFVDLERNSIVVEVRDNGRGLREDQLAALNNGQSIPSSKAGGSGVGLLTVLLLTRELGGHIAFGNVQEGGLAVSITVPSNTPIADDDDAARRPAETPTHDFADEEVSIR